MNEINFKKIKEYKDGSILTISYVGKKIRNFDDFKADSLIKSIFNSEINNLASIVLAIRIILNGCQEKHLGIKYSTKNNAEIIKHEEVISYNSGNLEEYIYRTESYDKNNNINVELNSKGECIYSLNLDNDEDYNNIEHSNLSAITEKFNRIIKHIQSLKNVRNLQIDKNSISLIETYKLFYDKTPNFSDEIIYIEIHIMISILAIFRISLNELITYTCFIKDIGKCIREKFKNKDNMIQILIMINNIIYATDDKIKLNLIQELNEFIYIPENDIESNIKLVKSNKDVLN